MWMFAVAACVIVLLCVIALVHEAATATRDRGIPDLRSERDDDGRDRDGA